MRHSILALALAASIATACGGHNAVSRTIEDATITAQVKTALLNDTELNPTIDVSTSNGVVTMTGSVRSQAEEQRAIQLARQVSGVRDVKANLTVSVGAGHHSSILIRRPSMPSSSRRRFVSSTSAAGPQTKHNVAGSCTSG